MDIMFIFVCGKYKQIYLEYEDDGEKVINLAGFECISQITKLKVSLTNFWEDIFMLRASKLFWTVSYHLDEIILITRYKVGSFAHKQNFAVSIK